MSSPLFVGCEDISFTPIGTSIVPSSAAVGQWQPDTTANSFRSGYPRYAMMLNTAVGAGADTIHYLRTQPYAGALFSSNNFWTTFRYNCTSGNGTQARQNIPIRFVDSNGVVRLRIKFSNVTAAPNDTFIVEKVNAAGTATQVGSTSVGRYASAAAGSSYIVNTDKIDIYVNYSASGTFSVYLNGVQTFTVTGVDLTTDGQTNLAAVDLGSADGSQNSTNSKSAYSEVLCTADDTRGLSGIAVQVATANGNTHNWDNGTAANFSANSMNTGQTSPQSSATTGQIDEYQVTPALPSGVFSVVSVVQHAQVAAGLTGLTKFDFMVRTGGSDFASSDFTPTLNWVTYATNWDLNPNTGSAWAIGQLLNSSTLFNMGLKSVT